MKMLDRKNWDLLSIIILALLLIGAALALSSTTLPIILGIPFLIFLPGYAILSVLFPALKDLNILERAAISFGISIAIIPVVGIGLNVTKFGAILSSILAIISVIALVFAVIGLVIRIRTLRPYLPVAPGKAWRWVTSFARKGGNMQKIASVALVIALLGTVFALMFVVANPPQGQSFTEFYIQNSEGKATNYPHNLAVGQAASVTLGIINHEHRQVNYSLEVWLTGITIVNNVTSIHSMYLFETRNISLAHVPVDVQDNTTRQYETNYTFQVQLPGVYKLFFLLYLDHEPALPADPIPYNNYAASESFRITDAIDNNVISLNLPLNVT
ncbi:MAG TPA: DUF1616 domain-containing protein [Methanomassiliicoccales archaeon]|jgi:uncharacterized membrane protein